jgi:hypothetical protein
VDIHKGQNEPRPINALIGKILFWVSLDETQVNINWVLGVLGKNKLGQMFFFSFVFTPCVPFLHIY